MFQQFTYLRFIFFIFIISKILHFVSPDSILSCYGENAVIKCKRESHYIIIKNVTFGYFYSIGKPNVTKCIRCPLSDLNIKQNCGISLLKTIGSKCNGKFLCTLEVIYSHYLPKEMLSCPEVGTVKLYIEYDCIQKDLLYDLGEVKKIQFVGGYITSVGYLFSKSNDLDDLDITARKFRSEKLLPLRSSFRPSTLLENRIRLPIVFQFQILEITLYSYQNNLHSSDFKNTCQIGKLYFQDYYAFNPNRYVQNSEQSDKTITFCQSSTNMIDKVYQMINVTEVFITINVNFANLTNLKSGLLIKFSAIFCPLLNITNAKIIYDNKIVHSHELKVNVFANIICDPGYFFISPTNNSKEISKIIICDHDKGMWEESTIPKECVNQFPNVSLTTNNIIITTHTSSFDSSSKVKNTISTIDNLFTTSNNNNNNTFLPISMTTIKKADMSILIKWLLSIFAIIFVGIVIFGVIFFKGKENMKCLSKNCTSFTKIFTKKESIISLNHNNTFPNIKYQHATDSGTPMSGSLGYIGHGFLSNGSCRYSNRTLTTRVDSKPTMTSRDSFPNSNNLSDFDMRQIHCEDELPTKVPKQSPIIRMLRSASSLRNHSLGVFGPMSLSRQSFNDPNANFYDSRYSNSQIALLKTRRNNITSELIDPIMWTSDISPSKTMPKYKTAYKRESDFSNNSQSDVSLKFNPKIYSPTVDTYLEPTPEISNQPDEEDSSEFPSRNNRKKSEDYMIYDHSRISSNNIDFTCPSSVTESGSEMNPNENEENKRFSMISNNYYGLQPLDSNAKNHSTRINNPILERNNNHSTESIYESIDDDPIYRSTLERRTMALPPPPNE